MPVSPDLSPIILPPNACTRSVYKKPSQLDRVLLQIEYGQVLYMEGCWIRWSEMLEKELKYQYEDREKRYRIVIFYVV